MRPPPKQGKPRQPRPLKPSSILLDDDHDEKGRGGGTTVRKDKVVNVKLPVQATLEPDAQWHSGVRQLMPQGLLDGMRDLNAFADRKVLPTRERQNGVTLSTTPGLRGQAILNSDDGGADPPLYSMMQLLAHNNTWYRAPVHDSLRVVAAQELIADINALHMKPDPVHQGRSASAHALRADELGIRFVHEGFGSFSSNTTNTVATLEAHSMQPLTEKMAGATMKASERAAMLSERDRQLRMVAFFDDDPLDDDIDPANAEPYGMEPGKYRMLQNLKLNVGERFENRHNTQRDFGENMPRRSQETIDGPRCAELRFPAHGHWRGCRRGDLCIVHQMAKRIGRPDFGYRQREYMSLKKEAEYVKRRRDGIPISDEVDGPANLCFDDIIFACTMYYNQVMACKRAPREAFNPFTVADGVYARDYLIPQEEGKSTGIEGNVPQFLANTRQFEKRALPDGREVSYYADRGAVFRPSLSEANTCFDAPKARPFAGPFRFAAAPATVFLPRQRLEQAATPAVAWIQFLRECHPLVLADRANLAAMEDGDDSSRAGGESLSGPLLPAVWLRRSLGLPSDAAAFERSIVNAMSPPAVAMSLRAFNTRSDSSLASLLCDWANLAFCSFERSVSLWLENVRRRNYALTIAPLMLFLRGTTLARNVHVFWSEVNKHSRALHVPTVIHAAVHATEKPATTEDAWRAVAKAILGDDFIIADTFIIWAVSIWRCAAAAYFNTALVRADPTETDEFDRHAHYFIETHTELLTHCLIRNETHGVPDRLLFEKAPTPVTAAPPVQTLRAPLPWLAVFYPAAHRVLCAEELPDFAPSLAYANPWYDMGNRKTQMSLFFMVLLLFMIKVMNQTCQRRGYMDILVRDIKAFPIIGELMRLIVYCVLVGNLPRAHSRMPLGARVRVRATFAPFASKEVDEDFLEWMQSKIMVVWFLAREYFFFHVENSYVIEKIFADSRKWGRFKAIVRITVAEIRRDITEQLCTDDGTVSWEGIERTELDYRDRHGKDHYGTSGRIKDRHERSLKQFTKIKKGRFEEVFKRKTKAIESSLHIDYEQAWQWLQADQRYYYCHLVAWYLAQRSHAEETPLKRQLVIELRWLKALGVSKTGMFDYLRPMQFEYYEYDTGDNGMKKRGLAMYQNNWRDYVTTRVVCRLVELYRDQTVFLLPLEQTLRQIHALRAPLGIEPHTATPPHLGRYWYCEGCHNWATSTTPRDLVLAGELKPTLDAFEALKTKVACCAASHTALYSERIHTTASKTATAAEIADLSFGSNANEASIVSFRAAYMDPLEGRLFCRRGQFKAPAAAAATPPTTAAEAVAAAGTAVAEDAVEVAEPEDLFETLILDGVDPIKWLKAHGKAAAAAAVSNATTFDTQVTAFQQGLGKSPFAVGEKNTVARLQDVTVLAVSNFSCNNPLVEVCGIGANWCLHGTSQGICVHCGRPCDVLNVNKTSAGLSCGKHPLVDAYPDNHRLWLSLGTTRAQVLQTLANPAPRRPCYVCRKGVASRYLEAYDFLYRLFVMPLCEHHYLCCSSLIPVAPKLNKLGGTAVVPPPLRIDHIMERVWSDM